MTKTRRVALTSVATLLLLGLAAPFAHAEMGPVDKVLQYVPGPDEVGLPPDLTDECAYVSTPDGTKVVCVPWGYVVPNEVRYMIDEH